MKCEVDYCIYNRRFSCILNETQVECMIVSIPEDILQELKESQLEEIKDCKHKEKILIFYR